MTITAILLIEVKQQSIGYVLWCLTPLSTIFQLYYDSVLLVEEA